MKKRLIQFGLSLFAASVTIYGVYYSYLMEVDRENSVVATAAQERISHVAAALSQSLNVRLNHTRSLAAFVRTHKDFTEEHFHIFASTLQKDLVGLRSLQLAPNGIVRYLTNLEQNRAALGHDLFADPKRRPLVQKSVDTRMYIIAGPIDLVQGGKAIIARLPVFFPKTDTGGDEFWGFATVLIDVEPLLDDSGYTDLASEYALAIRGKDGLGANGDVFFGAAEVFDAPIATASVVLPGGSWIIGVQPKAGAMRDESFFASGWYLMVGVLLAAAVGLVSFSTMEYPIRLRRAVDQATADLQVAAEETKQANLAKTEFLATMSHELRTPLTSITGVLQLAKGGVLGDIAEKAQQMLNIALSNSLRLKALIDDILDIEKIEAGKMEFVLAPMSASELVQKAASSNIGYTETHNAEITVHESQSTAEVDGDEGRLMQVMSNLISNAAKFSPPGGVVEIGVFDRGDKVRFSVKDYGSGIPEEFRSRIFEKFSQAATGDARPIGGTGLGLNISRAIVEYHGGEIDYISEAGKGTEFYFDLPRIGQ